VLSTSAVDEIGFYIVTSPFGTVAEILVASFGVRVGASNDLLSVPGDRGAGAPNPLYARRRAVKRLGGRPLLTGGAS